MEQLLAKYGKRLDTDQMCILLDKESSINPLWLSIAVEELRVYGNFRKVSEKIEQLADGLLEYVYSLCVDYLGYETLSLCGVSSGIFQLLLDIH